MAAKYIKPEIGATYTQRSGGEYLCLFVSDAEKVEHGECSAVMIRIKDGWELIAHGVQQNEDGTIEWNYSTGGHWVEGTEDVRLEIWEGNDPDQGSMIKSFDDRIEAAKWIYENERLYPNWRLRIAWRRRGIWVG